MILILPVIILPVSLKALRKQPSKLELESNLSKTFPVNCKLILINLSTWSLALSA